MLASLLFPYDDDAKKLIEGWLSELETEKCIVRYIVRETAYIQICNWHEHQKIDKPSGSKLPPFDESSRALAKSLEASSEDLGSGSGPGSGSRTKDQGRGEKARADALAVPGLDLKAWEEWQAYRAERKPAIKAASLVAAAQELAAFGDQQGIVVKHSKAQGYQGLFAPKTATGPNGRHPEDTGWRPPPDEPRAAK